MNSTIINKTLYLYLETERTALRKYLIFMDIFVASFLICFGYVGNIISIIVLRKDTRMRRVTRSLLQVLAVTDLLYLSCSILYQPMFAVAFDPYWGKGFVSGYLTIEPYIGPMISVTSMAGTWTIVLITTDRFIAIRYPLRARTLFTSMKVRIFVLIIWILSIGFNAVRFTGSKIPHKQDPSTGGVVLMMPLHEDLQYSAYYNLIYQVVLVFVFRIFVPLIALIFLNINLIWEIQKSRRSARRTSYPGESDVGLTSKRSTVMLIIVVFIFIICMIPNIYMRVFWLSRVMRRDITLEDIHKTIYDDKLLYTYSTAKLFMTLNSSVNFIVYVMVGKRFRKNLKQTFNSILRCCKQHK